MATGNEGDALRSGLVGRWVKVARTPQVERYPDNLEFTKLGTFVGTNDSGSPYHPFWDAGRFQLVAGGKVRIPTANDAQFDYPAVLAGDELTFVVGDQEVVRYRRKQ